MKLNTKLYLNPIDVVKREYSKPNVIRSFAEQGIWASEKILVDKYFKQGESVLDIACGPGRTAIPLTRKGLKVTGIDFLSETIETAIIRMRKNKVNIKFLLMDANELKFPCDSFDNVVFFYNSFELIWGRSNRIKLLQEVYRILKPKGYFLLTSRSGFAFGKRWVVWPWLLIRTFMLKPIGIGNHHLQLGDVFSKGTYHRYQSTFSIRKDLKKIGFKCELFNSNKNIEQKKKNTFLTNFSADKCLFFVVRKP